MRYCKAIILLPALVAWTVIGVHGQSSIPRDIRGLEDEIARGILDGNLIETNFRNHGELARWNDLPWGVWPRGGAGGRHIDGVGIIITGRVPGERAKWPFYGGAQDTLVNPVILTYRDAGKTQGPSGELWGWLPLPGFHNPTRFNALGVLEPTPALSDDPSSWPNDWPDRRDNPDDPGWAGQWNGFFGRGVFNADLESYYVIDDFSDMEYSVDPNTGLPLSDVGVFYPSPSDSTIGGLGLQVGVRLFQWANVLAQDVMFILYRITNVGETAYVANQADDEGLWFAQIMDYGLGNEEGDESAAFDAQQDVTFGWDQDGIGSRMDGSLYNLGYTGFAFLESPARDRDGIDNDEDGITDEQRFGGPGVLIEGQSMIKSIVEGSYDMTLFESVNGPLEERPAFEAGLWWTGDENLDWVGFADDNGNGVYDAGENANSDVGLDGQGPFDLGYPGPDTGEGNGIPDAGEPNFDELDIDESDQIGLTGFDLSNRPFYESGDNLRDDTWLFDRIFNFAEPTITTGTKPDTLLADVEPFLLFTSGTVSLDPNTTKFFSTAWIFGADENDFFRNRRSVQAIYNADYQFAQPPFTPKLTAVPGDGRVVLSWDTIAVNSFDRFTQEFDFEGFRLYKGTDPLLSDARSITNVEGTPTFLKPLGQWDLDNDISGPYTVLEGSATFHMGDNTGLSYFYVDTNVRNGVPYYYALVAYDRGVRDSLGRVEIDPQENVFNVSVDLTGKILGTSQNSAVVVPRSRPAGFVGGGTNEDLSAVTEGIGTGSLSVRVVSDDLVKESSVYQVRFFSDLVEATDLVETTSYEIVDIAEGVTLVGPSAIVDTSPLVDGLVVEIQNDELTGRRVEYNPARLGYRSLGGTANETYDTDPRELDDVSSNWIATISVDATGLAAPSSDDYELRWVSDSLYTPARFGRFLRQAIPVFAVNATKDRAAELFIQDNNESGEFDAGDELIIYEREGVFRKYRHRVLFTVPGGETSAPPSAGDVLRVGVRKEFATGDMFQFTVRKATIDSDLARNELDDIAVVPNPYVGGSEFELRSQISGRGERRIQFINLPQQCSISVFNLRGELVATIDHDGVGTNGAEYWDLTTLDGQDVAFGVYVYHVKAEGIGEHVGKFALVK